MCASSDNGEEGVPRDTDTMPLLKFPRTHHIADLGGSAVTRDDLIFSKQQAEEWLSHGTTIVEEKVDGANLGISIDPETMQFRV